MISRSLMARLETQLDTLETVLGGRTRSCWRDGRRRARGRRTNIWHTWRGITTSVVR